MRTEATDPPSRRRHAPALWSVASDVAADDAALGVAHEEDDFIALLGGGQLCLDAFHSVADVEAGEVEISVNLLDVADGVVAEVAATQTYTVDAGVADGLAGGLDVGRDVLVDEGAALNHHVRADVAELVHERAAADDGEIVDHHLAGQLRGVADDDVVAYGAVVGHMAVGHDEAVVAYGGAAAGGGAAVHGDALADGGVVADDGQGVLAAELEVLRYGADDGTGEYGAVTSDAGAFKDGYVAADARALADFHIGVDGDERINHHARRNLGGGMHVG